MGPQDFQEYGPMNRRGRRGVQADMATRTTDSTQRMPALGRDHEHPAPAPRRSRGRGVALALVVLVLGAIGGGTYAGLRYLDQRYNGRIFPNVAIQNIDLSEQTPAVARQAVEARIAPFLAAPVVFEWGNQRWTPTAADLGIAVDVDAQLAAAMALGRGNGLFRNANQVLSTYQNGVNLPLTITADAAKIQQYLARVGAPLEAGPVEANLWLDPVSGVLNITESREGRMLLLDDTVNEALGNLAALEPALVPLHTAPLKPMLTSAGIAEARRTIEAMTQAPLQATFQDQTFALAQIDIASMIVITRTVGVNGPLLNAQLNQEPLQKWVTRVADKIGRDSVEPRVDWNGGALLTTQAGRSAYRLDIERTVARINELIVADERTMPLPVNEIQPQVTPETLATLGINEVVAEGRSDFSGSAAYRITNIKAGVRRMDGILIPPGGEFSFNENVGEIDASNGFTEGYAIVGNRTQKEPGGGICQVSTTLFRAAFYAGVPITDWTPHRFRISWYEQYDSIGMDSTIFTGGGPDLRFVNDTGKWMLVEGTVDEAQALVTFRLYGTPVAGREVRRSEAAISARTAAPTVPVYINDPEQPVGGYYQTDQARGGLQVQITRTVLQNGVVASTRTFITTFQPWPNIFLKNPKTALPPGGKLGSG